MNKYSLASIKSKHLVVTSLIFYLFSLWLPVTKDRDVLSGMEDLFIGIAMLIAIPITWVFSPALGLRDDSGAAIWILFFTWLANICYFIALCFIALCLPFSKKPRVTTPIWALLALLLSLLALLLSLSSFLPSPGLNYPHFVGYYFKLAAFITLFAYSVVIIKKWEYNLTY